MKKSVGLVLVSLLTLLAGLALSPEIGYALPYTTESVGPNNQLSSSPTAYIPERKITIPRNSALEMPNLSGAEDMVYDLETEQIYVADTLNKRIVILNKSDSQYTYEIKNFTNENGEVTNFKNPTGLALNKDYFLVADKQLESIVVFDKETLSFVKEIKKPESNLIGSLSRFAPQKICLDDRGNLYAVLEGSIKGIMELDFEGNFIGYIGANQAQGSLLSKIQNIFGFEDDDSLLASGLSVTNVAIDSKGLVYTVTNKASSGVIKKLNTTGNAIMSPSTNEEKTVQVYIDQSENIYSVQSDGYVTVYDSYGALLFRFGGRGEEEILGSFKSPVAICGTKDREIMVLDKETNLIILFTPTHFANVLFDAVDYYKDGLYLQGEESWLEVLKYDSKFILAYKALGKASMKKGDYDLALKQFKLAEDKAGYSDAFWQIRDNWIRNNLVYVIIPIICLVILVLVYKFIKQKKPALVAPLGKAKHAVTNAPVLRDLAFGFDYLRSPRNAVYEIKFKNRSSLIGAIILYILFAVIEILKVYLTGYLFNGTSGTVDGIRTILLSIGTLLALVVSNYLVSSVSDGEGKLKETFISFIYALIPYLIMALPIFLVSNILTYNESFIYYVLYIITYGWCAINVISTIMELHDYSFGKALLNIILTIICLVLILVFIFIVYLLGYQLIAFIISLFKGI